MQQKMKLGAKAVAEVVHPNGIVDRFGRPFSQKIQIASTWFIEHWRQGKMLSKQVEQNICPDEFINYVLDAALSGDTVISSWYVAISTGTVTPAAGMTYASHSGFTETDGYSGNRPAWVDAGASSKVITSAASKASFTMTSALTITGCALVGGGSTPTTKNDTAGGGTLGPVAGFTGGSVALAIDDVLKVYMEITGSDV